MNLLEKDQQNIKQWIQEKCGAMKCFCCGSGKWQILPFSAITLGFDVHSTRFYYHQGIPQIGVRCNYCGHIVWFSTAILGFQPDKPKEEKIEK